MHNSDTYRQTDNIALTPKVSLDQWRALHAVVDSGGFAQAAMAMHRSQSSVSYAVNRLQEQLGIKLLQIEGRKAVLTEAGQIILLQSKQLVADASEIEQQARFLEKGWEAEIKIAVEASFPTDIIMRVLKEFEAQCKQTRIRLEEVVLSGAEDALLEGHADLAISPFIPQGYLADELLKVNFIAVASPEHALHQLNREITTKDLMRETHVILTDSGSKGADLGWISSHRRWTVTSPDSAYKIIGNGLGYGWLPEKGITEKIQKKELKVLPLHKGQLTSTLLYLVYADLDRIGPATRQFAEILKKQCLSK